MTDKVCRPARRVPRAPHRCRVPVLGIGKQPLLAQQALIGMWRKTLAAGGQGGWWQSAAMPQKPGTGASLRLSHQPPGPLPARTAMRNLMIKSGSLHDRGARPTFLGSRDARTCCCNSHLRRLTQLERLDLSDTQLTDAGLVHLQGMGQLQTLQLGGTSVTNQGVKKLQQALPKCAIEP